MSETIPAAGTRPAVVPELAIVPHSARLPETRPTRLMPVADAILWSPVVGAHRPAPTIPAPLPMFFTQHTLRKLQDRLATVSNGLGIGLLAGRRYVDRTGAPFVVIDGALPLPALAAEEELRTALIQGRISASGIDIVGWYRSHAVSDPALTASDVETHAQVFEDTPDASIIVVVAAGGDAGAVFRQSSSHAWPVETLPFYEWIAEPGRAEGPQQTTVSWYNYQPSEPVVRVSHAPAVPAHPVAHTKERSTPPSVLFPAPDGDDDEPLADAAAPRPRKHALLKPAIYAACALGGAVLVGALWAILGSGEASSSSRDGSGNAGVGEVTAAFATATLDRRADTLALALSAFNDRSRMFDAKQMTCAGLSRGLQQVEDQWLSYNLARREAVAPFDPQRESRDRRLYADVRDVERRFERSGCPRP